MTDKLSPLHSIHLDAGASFTDFAGWQMPVSYGSDLGEHHAVRTAAGIFDISHMSEFLVDGTDAAAFLDFALAGWLSQVAVDQAKYSLLLSPEGGIVDDLVVYRQAEQRFLVVANASNREPVATALAERTAGFAVDVSDLSDEIALIAVQGPRSREILAATAGLDAPGLDELKYYWQLDGNFDGQPVHIGRTGYTGEDGFELYIAVDAAVGLWRALLDAGTPLGLIPAGLASRDTLRLEAGMPLYGHELDLDTFPAQAGLGRVVSLKKEVDFVGRAAIEAGPPDGARVLVGLIAEGRRAGRAGYEVYSLPEAGPTPPVTDDGAFPSAVRAVGIEGEQPVGTITSGALSPTLGHPIAMAFVDPAVAEPGTELFIDVRGTRTPATIVPLPFYQREAK